MNSLLKIGGDLVMNLKFLAKKHWLLNSLKKKVSKEIYRKASVIINNTNEETSYDKVYESINKLLTLEWKLNKICYYLKKTLEEKAEKTGAQS